jgi:hypothetical protein
MPLEDMGAMRENCDPLDVLTILVRRSLELPVGENPTRAVGVVSNWVEPQPWPLWLTRHALIFSRTSASVVKYTLPSR